MIFAISASKTAPETASLGILRKCFRITKPLIISTTAKVVMQIIKVREGVSFESVTDKNAVTLKSSSSEKIYRTGGVTAPYTNFTYNIREQCVVPQKNLTLDLMKKNGKPVFYKYDYPATASQATVSEYMQKLLTKSLEERNRSRLPKRWTAR